jgi:drug/metabolite transporter (DMT)-like permease
MGFLILSILASTAILLLFRIFETHRIRLLPAIAINYLAASGLALFISGRSGSLIPKELASWMWMAIIIGIIFVLMFILIGKTTQKAGITNTSVASRMSVVIPMIFSIIYYGETISFLKTVGLLLAPVSVLLVVYRNQSSGRSGGQMWLPILVFFGVGLTDSLVKYTQQDHLVSQQVITFSGYLFLISMVSSGLLLLGRHKKPLIQKKEWIGGLFLGICNLASLYFFIQALNHSGFDSSIVFGINSTGIVFLSSLAGFSVFKEHLSRLNILGLALAMGVLVILYYV